MAGRILEAKAAACMDTGYSRAELLQMKTMDIVAPEQAGLVAQRMQRSQQSGRFVFETYHCRKDGTEYPAEIKTCSIEYDGQPCIPGLARDIPERKRKKAALRESERQKALILNSVAVKIVYYDRGLRIIWANRAAAQMLGMSKDDLVGGYCYEILHQRKSLATIACFRAQGMPVRPDSRLRGDAAGLGRGGGGLKKLPGRRR